MIINRLRYGAINNKKIIVFLFGLSIIAIICGTLFTTILSNSDNAMIKEYIQNYINSIKISSINNCFFNVLLSNFLFIIFIWLLGISIIGLPIIVFAYFFKVFLLGFSISSFILTYKFKGLLISFFYLFPSQIILILVYTLLSLYGIKVSNNFIYSLFNKKNINQHLIMKKYLKILIISLSISLICILYDSFLLPIVLQKIVNLIKI